jgi:hypothetical protein
MDLETAFDNFRSYPAHPEPPAQLIVERPLDAGTHLAAGCTIASDACLFARYSDAAARRRWPTLLPELDQRLLHELALLPIHLR